MIYRQLSRKAWLAVKKPLGWSEILRMPEQTHWPTGWVSSQDYKPYNSSCVSALFVLFPCLMFNFLALHSYREQVEKVTRLRDDTVRAIIKNSHDIAVFKEEVSQQLKHVREFAEEN
jgi:hypothetical protein